MYLSDSISQITIYTLPSKTYIFYFYKAYVTYMNVSWAFVYKLQEASKIKGKAGRASPLYLVMLVFLLAQGQSFLYKAG